MIVVRAETAEDYTAIRRVNELAFGRPDEADLVEALRVIAEPQVSLVAVKGGEVVGHIFFSPVTVELAGPAAVALALAPMAVVPELQRQGAGSRLVREGLKACQDIGCSVVFVLGHPDYYPRFGFVPASLKGLRCEYDVPEEAFMVAELTPGALEGWHGVVKYLPEFGRV